MKFTYQTPLARSILRVVGVYALLETAAFAAVWYILRIPLISLTLFLLVQFLFQTALICFLIIGSGFFYISNTREHLDEVNLANRVTLLRVSLLPLLLFLLLAGRAYTTWPVLIPILAVTFLTDLVDGRISRSLNQVTQMGKILDSVSDYSLLFVLAVTYTVYRLLPLWFFCLLTFRLAFQAVGMFVILMRRKQVEPKPTLLGKVAVATTMSLFAIEALKLIPLVATTHAGVFSIVEYAAGAIITISIFDKGFFFYRDASKNRP